MSPPRLILGPPAALESALATAVREHKARKPLAPLTILVGETLLRPYLRRRLAVLAGGHVNLKLVTVGELALALGEPSLVARGREPLPFLGDRILAQQVASAARGYFFPVAHTPGFAAALYRLFRELRQADVSPEAFAAGASAAPENVEKVGELADLYARYEEQRVAFYAADDGLKAADPALFGSEALLVYGVWDPWATLRSVLEALGELAPVTFYLPETGGDPDLVHADLRLWLRGLGATPERAEADEEGEGSSVVHLQGHLFSPDGPAPDDGACRVVSAPDPPREVRDAARACMRWAREGIAFHEMAVAYRHGDRHRALIESTFREAGVPIYLHEGTPLAERPLGRRVLALLDLVDSKLERRAVMEFLTDARMPKATWERFGSIPSHRWDKFSRQAGIVAGPEQWRERLELYRAAQEERHRERDWLPERLEAIDQLAAFIGELGDHMGGRPEAGTWSEHLGYLRQLFESYVEGGEPILGALEDLSRLDRLSGPVPFERFRQTVKGVIENLRISDVEPGQQGAFARRGVNVLDVNSLRHLRFRAVAVLGLAERSFPPPPRQDPLLLDEERRQLNALNGWELPLRALGADREPMQFALAVGAATERIQLSYARTETGDVRPQLPSGFFRAAATALAGEPIRVQDVDELDLPFYTRVPAGRVGATRIEDALTETDYDRTLVETEPELARAVLRRRQPSFTRATVAEDSHWEPRLTPYDGVLSEESLEQLAAHRSLDRPQSPGALETYAECPYRFFLSKVLRIEPVEEPEEITRISPLAKGTLVHRVLQRFLLDCGDADPPSTERRAAHLDRLRAIADAACDEAESRGLTGFPLLWKADRQTIIEDLIAWYDREVQDAAAGYTHGTFELRFGSDQRYDDDPESDLSTAVPLVVEVEGGRLELQGRMDRLNWRSSPPGFRVIDYKTGRAWDTKDATLDGGRTLQLPIYLLAAAKVLDMAPADGEAQYFFVTRRGDFRRVKFPGSTLTERQGDFHAVIRGLAEGIGRGDFHLEPDDKKNCRFCDFDSLCDTRRQIFRDRKEEDPLVVAFTERSKIS